MRRNFRSPHRIGFLETAHYASKSNVAETGESSEIVSLF
jgi:hypothetical protein